MRNKKIVTYVRWKQILSPAARKFKATSRKDHYSSLLRPQVVLLVDFLDAGYTPTPERHCDALERLLEPVRAEGLFAAPGRNHFSRQCQALTAIQAYDWLGRKF